jgi:hypothetical protein
VQVIIVNCVAKLPSLELPYAKGCSDRKQSGLAPHPYPTKHQLSIPHTKRTANFSCPDQAEAIPFPTKTRW